MHRCELNRKRIWKFILLQSHTQCRFGDGQNVVVGSSFTTHTIPICKCVRKWWTSLLMLRHSCEILMVSFLLKAVNQFCFTMEFEVLKLTDVKERVFLLCRKEKWGTICKGFLCGSYLSFVCLFLFFLVEGHDLNGLEESLQADLNILVTENIGVL